MQESENKKVMSLLQSPAVETQINDQQKGGQSAKEEERVGLASKVQEFLKKGGKVKKVASSTGRKRIQKPKKDSIKKVASSGGGSQKAWAGLKIKAGTRLEWTGKSRGPASGTPTKKIYAEVFNVGSMQCFLYVNGKRVSPKRPFGLDGATFDGVVAMECYVRANLLGDVAMQKIIKDAQNNPKSKYLDKSKGVFNCVPCDGWDVWSVKVGKESRTVHELWKTRA